MEIVRGAHLGPERHVPCTPLLSVHWTPASDHAWLRVREDTPDQVGFAAIRSDQFACAPCRRGRGNVAEHSEREVLDLDLLARTMHAHGRTIGREGRTWWRSTGSSLHELRADS